MADLDGDGRNDFITATYDGSPHVAWGVEGGFGEPEHLVDADGARIGLEMMWDHGEKRWRDVFHPHCTSAAVVDWDGDGDLDLLMGEKNEGGLHLMMNGGTPKAPAFTGDSEEVLANGEPFACPGGMTAPVVVDWDGDGLFDVVCGSYGDERDADVPLGAVHLFRNVGEAGAPRFAAGVHLIPPAAEMGPDRPCVGLYVDPVDHDGDGDLDLVVGGYSAEAPGEKRSGRIWFYERED